MVENPSFNKNCNHSRKRAKQFGGHDESTQMFKPIYFKIFPHVLKFSSFLHKIRVVSKQKVFTWMQCSNNFTFARIISNLPEFIWTGGQVPPISYAYDYNVKKLSFIFLSNYNQTFIFTLNTLTKCVQYCSYYVILISNIKEINCQIYI